MPKMLKTFDIFSVKVPSFTMRSEESVKTNIGGCCSIIIIYIILMYAAHKFNHLATKSNPQITSYEMTDAFGVNDLFETSKSDFMLAVAIEHANTG